MGSTSKLAGKKLLILILIFILPLFVYSTINPSTSSKKLTKRTASDIYQLTLSNNIRSNNHARENNSKFIKLIPDWKKISSSETKQYTILETPLYYHQNDIFKIMTEEVYQHVIGARDKRIVPQIQRWVLLQDKVTKETYSFVMYIIPSLNYTYNYAKQINTNTYLQKDSDFDGMILFYTTDGDFINGWIYEFGDLMLGLLPQGAKSTYNSILSSYLKVCIYTMELDVNTKGINEVMGSNCMSTFIPPQNNDAERIDPSQLDLINLKNISEREFYSELHEADSTSPINTTQTDIPQNISQVNRSKIQSVTAPGQNIPSKTITPSPPSVSTEIQNQIYYPQKEITNCNNQNKPYSDKVFKTLNGNSNIRNKISMLKAYARNADHEYGLTINNNSQSYYIHKNEIQEGSRGEIVSTFNWETALMIHTHHSSRNIKVTNFTGPSGNDIDNTLAAGQIIVRNSGKGYIGTAIFAYDTSEYLMIVYDWQKALKFYSKYRNSFTNTSSRVGSFRNETFREQYHNIRERLEEKGFSNQDAHDYATAYLFERFNVGLKLMKKEPQSDSYKELKLRYDSKTDTFHPTICQ